MSDNVGDDARSADAVAIRLSERDWKKDAWRELKKAPFTAKFGLLVILIYVFVAVFAPFLTPYGESEIVRYKPTDDSHFRDQKFTPVQAKERAAAKEDEAS